MIMSRASWQKVRQPDALAQMSHAKPADSVGEMPPLPTNNP
jgi:hypothetical protein